MNFQLYKDISLWLNKESDTEKLEKLENLMHEGRYYATIWGHYSAGKSKLINNILGKDILPTKSRETTAVLTYIQYGTNEECHIFKNNGTCEVITLDFLKEIFQNTDQSNVDIEKIEHIEVYVNSSTLKNGLVIVDTPGVNTIIQKHQQLAADTIEQSGKIIYVMGNSLTNVDKQFIENINRCGIDITFVRTKCDQIKETEENISEALDKEKNILEKILNKKIKFIPVSNEYAHELFSNIKLVHSELENISESISQQLQQSMIERLKVFANTYQNEIRETCAQIENILSSKNSELSKEMCRFETEIQSLENMQKKSQEKVQFKINQSVNDAKSDIDEIVIKNIDILKKQLNNVIYSDDAEQQIKKIYDSNLSSNIMQIQQLLDNHFDTIIRNEHLAISEVVNDIYAFDSPTYTEIQRENSIALDIYRAKLQQVKNNLEKIQNDKNNNSIDENKLKLEFDEEFGQSFEETMEMLDNALKEIPTDVIMKLSDDQPIQPSKILKGVGNITDIALLFIPGTAIAGGLKAVTNSTKVAQSLNKFGKLGQIIINTGKKTADYANIIDKVKDFTYNLKLLNDRRSYSTQKQKEQAKSLIDAVSTTVGNAYDAVKESKNQGNILDALTVAYWTEKIGSKFDKPLKMEVDVLQEENRKANIKLLTDKQQKLSEERLKKKRELGLFESKKKELEAEEQEANLVLQKIQEEIELRENDLSAKAKKQGLLNYIESYTSFAEKTFEQTANALQKKYHEEARENIVFYLATKNADLISAINERRTGLQSLIDSKNNKSDLEDKLKLGKQYLAQIEEII